MREHLIRTAVRLSDNIDRTIAEAEKRIQILQKMQISRNRNCDEQICRFVQMIAEMRENKQKVNKILAELNHNR